MLFVLLTGIVRAFALIAVAVGVWTMYQMIKVALDSDYCDHIYEDYCSRCNPGGI
jgi:hypothetical protein